MSVIVTVAAAASVTVGAKVFAGIATAVAASVGMKAVELAQSQMEDEQRARRLSQDAAEALSQGNEVEISLATTAALEQAVAERCSLRFQDDRVDLTIERDIRGRVTVRAHGENVGRAELQERASRLLGLIVQQVAYRSLVQKMRQHGFAVESEERVADGTVKLRIRRPGS